MIEVVEAIKDLIKKQLDDFAAKLSSKLRTKFNEEIEAKRKALIFEAASKIMTTCQLRSIDRDSTEIRIVVNSKQEAGE